VSSARARAAFVARAEWLEQEASAKGDKGARARALLTVSELYAIVGDLERAELTAKQVRESSSALALGRQQARALMAQPRDEVRVVEALDLEARVSPTPAARAHAALLAAEMLRIAGDDDAAAKRYDAAMRAAPGDVRAPVARAVRALARDETASPALRMPDAPQLAPVAQAIGTALKLRGVERKDAGAPIEALPNDVMRRARAVLDKADVMSAAPLLAELGEVQGLTRGAMWLASALGATKPALRADAAEWLRKLVDDVDDLSRRALAACAVELGNAKLVDEAIGGGRGFLPAERASLRALVGLPLSPASEDIDAITSTAGLAPLAAALGAVTTPAGGDEREAEMRTRAERVAGSAGSRAAVRVGRLLAAGAAVSSIETALEAFGDAKPAGARAVALEMSARGGRFFEVCDAIQAWGEARDASDEARAQAALASAIVAERAGDRSRALEAFKAARRADPTCEVALRAVAALEETDLIAELNAMADELGDNVRGALARLEAVARGDALDDATRAELLEKAHRAAPDIPIAAFLAERIARRTGNIDEVLRWVRERRANATDAVESALDAVR
jgi:hypothetical protein